MERFFIGIYGNFKKRRPVFYISLIASFLVVVFFAFQVKFEEDISKVLPNDKKIAKLNEVFTGSKFMDRLVVTVSLKDTHAIAQPDRLVQYADEFSTEVEASLRPYVSKMQSRVNDETVTELLGVISSNLPVYLDEADYDSIEAIIEPAAVEETLARNLRSLTSPAGFALKTMISNDPVGISIPGIRKLQQLQYDENFELYDNYIITKDHRHLMLFITPAYAPVNTGKNALLLQGLDSIISAKSGSFSNINAAYFGATAVSVGNSLQLRNDIILTQGITVLFLIVFFGFYFRQKRAPFLILMPVLFGALFSLATIYFIKGSISVIALGAGSVVLGIAVNYSLHVFNHYRHTRKIEAVIRDLARPLTIGSFTTIGGFLCLQFVKSEMLKDLGLFAALSLVGAALFSLIFLPHFVASKQEKDSFVTTRLSWIDRIASYRPEYKKVIITAILVLTVVFAYTSRQVRFESDLNRMNYMSDKLKLEESNLNRINEYALKSVYLIAEGRSLNEALENNEKLTSGIRRLKEQDVIKKFSGVSSLLISDLLQKIRIERWNAFWTSEKKQQLITTLEKEGAALGYKPSAFENFKILLNREYRPIEKEAMDVIRKSFLDDFISEKPGHATVITIVKVPMENKAAVYQAFENTPSVIVVDKQYLTSKLVEIINSDFTSIALMSSILVFVVLLITYGRIELTLVSFVPMFITWVWILGIMGLFDIRFNIINIIISALIFGLGDDYSLFIMDGLLQEYKTGRKNLSSYKSSIILSAITTIAGLGVLIFAEHPALKSIALISIIGILCVVLMSQMLIPFFFAVLIKNRTEKKQFPWTLTGVVKSVFVFSCFVSGSVLLTFLGLLFAGIKAKNSERIKLLYHRIISRCCRFLMYIMANVKKEIINPQGEDFSKPAVIISNHQSFVDILSIVMLHPKLILFTNDWVWNSPVFGAVVRMAGYYPVSHGLENSVDLIAERVKAGYSVVIFPEGTRSVDGVMKRFHKGAFLLAEKLNIDILPIVIHGSGYTMPKGDFLLKDGRITIKFLPRITPGSTEHGRGYGETTKAVSRYFKEELNKLTREIEQPAYFREQLVYNYIYKGPVLEWYMKVKVSMEKNYQLFNDLLPRFGTILDAGCGYGFMSYMLAFASPGRVITGIDYDKEKIDTANNCFSKTNNINFKFVNVLQYNFESYDGIIMADMLHYLQHDEQNEVIKKCIAHLNPGGTLVIRDGNKDFADRHKGTRLTELFSTTFLGFNKTSGHDLSFLSACSIREIASYYNLECREIDDTKYTSNMIFVIKKPVQVSNEQI